MNHEDLQTKTNTGGDQPSNVVQFNGFARKSPVAPEAPAIPKEERVRQIEEELRKQRHALATTQASLTPLLERMDKDGIDDPMLSMTISGECHKIARAAKHIAELVEEMNALTNEADGPSIADAEANTSADIVEWPGSGARSR